MILYMLHAVAIASPCHPYIWSTTVLHDTTHPHGIFEKQGGIILMETDAHKCIPCLDLLTAEGSEVALLFLSVAAGSVKWKITKKGDVNSPI